MKVYQKRARTLNESLVAGAALIALGVVVHLTDIDRAVARPQAEGPKASAAVSAAKQSVVELPITVNLKSLEDRLAAAIPNRLVTISENNVVFVEAKRAKYEYPCFRHWRWYSCDGWTKIAPAIKGDVWGSVDRDGRAKISGDNGRLRVALPISARISGKALGIQETATAKAVIYVDLTPSISEDWELDLKVRPDYSWTQRPTLKLFDVFKITIGSKVDPKLREALAHLTAEMPSLLKALDLPEKARRAWAEVQEPVVIGEKPPASVEFRPTRAGFSGFSVADNILSTVILAEGAANVVIGSTQAKPKTLLPKLERVAPSGQGFAVNLPVAIDVGEVSKLVDERLGADRTVDLNSGKFGGELTVISASIQARDDGKLSLRADLRYDDRSKWLRTVDRFGWFDIEGRVTFEITPVLDSKTRTLAAKTVRLDSRTNNRVADALVDIADLPGVREIFARSLRYEYGQSVDEAMARINKAFDVESAGGMRLSGVLTTLGPTDLLIRKDQIRIILEATGNGRLGVGI